MRIVRGATSKIIFYGGYDDAERRIIIFVPDGCGYSRGRAKKMISPLSILHQGGTTTAESSHIEDYPGLSSCCSICDREYPWPVTRHDSCKFGYGGFSIVFTVQARANLKSHSL